MFPTPCVTLARCQNLISRKKLGHGVCRNAEGNALEIQQHVLAVRAQLE
jgi:hypothetical protein